MNETKKIVVKGFFWMFLAGLFVNIVQFLSKIILARLLTPAEFGVVSIAISIVAFTGFFQDLGLSSALIQRKTNIEESFNSVLIFVTIVGSILSIILFLFSGQLSLYFNNLDLETVIKLISVTLFLGALTTPYISYLSKNLLFFRKFISEIIPIILGSTISVILAFYKFGYLSLAIGYLTGSASYALLLVLLSPWKPKISFDFSVFKQLISYSKFIFFGNLAAIILSQGDNFVIGKSLGAVELGYYAIAYTLATLPSVNIVHVISKVVFPTFAKLQDDKEKLKKSFIKTSRLISFIVFPIILGTITISQFLFTVVLGEKWLPAYAPLIILSFLAIFKSLQVIPSFFLQSTGYSRKDANITFISTILEVILIFPLTYKFGISGTALSVTLAYGLSFINYIIACPKLLEINSFVFIKTLLPSIIGAIIMFFAGILTISFLSNLYTLINLLVVIIVCFLSYILIMLIINREFLAEIYSLFISFFNKNQ